MISACSVEMKEFVPHETVVISPKANSNPVLKHARAS